MDRIENRGASPESVLALTFSRKAAEQLRDRVTARLGRTTSSAMCSTFHSFAYGLIRRYSPPELYAGPLRLLSAPEQDVVLRELLDRRPRSRCSGRTRCGGRRRPAASPTRWPRSSAGPGRRASMHERCAPSGRAHDLPEFVAAGWFLEQYLQNLDAPERHRLRRPDPACGHRGGRPPVPSCARSSSTCSWTSTRTPTRVRCGCSGRWPATARNLTVVGDPHQSIYAFRGAEVRGILDFPDQFRDRDGRPGRRPGALRAYAGSARASCWPASGSPRGSR